MSSMIRLWTISLTNPMLAFRALQLFSNPYQSAKFNWWTSIIIYGIGYFAVSSLFIGFNVASLGGFVFLLAFFLLITFTLIKNYFYTLMISNHKKQLVNFQDVALLTTLSDIPILLGFPLIYIMSFYLDGTLMFLVLILFIWFLLRNRSRLFQAVYGVPTRFVFAVSFGLWAMILVLMLFFTIYLGVSIQLLISYLLS